MTALPNLMAQLDELEAQLPQLLSDHPEEVEFWPVFAGMADVIEDAAGAHAAVVSERIDSMLVPVRLHFESEG